jgi:CheY-like chemotaxis protein
MGPRILVIEDNPHNLYLMRFILESNECEVLAAQDDRTGIELASRVEPVLILLDIQLPSMDGYAVVRELRKNPRLESIPIVAVTSYAMVGDRERILAAGCTGYIEKPSDPETSMAEVAQHLPPEGATGAEGS